MKTISYKGALYILAAPSWKPGQPVPEGYRVVFGRLVKYDGKPSSYHDPSTKAWKASSSAHSVEEHREAARLHNSAADIHMKAADDFSRMGARSKEKKHMEAAQVHHKQAFKHDTGAEWLEGQQKRHPIKKK